MIKKFKATVRFFLSQFVPEWVNVQIGNLTLDKGETLFTKFCHLYFNQAPKGKEGIILVDIFFVPEVLIAYGFFINSLRAKHGSTVRHFIYQHGLIKPKIAAVYNALGSSGPLRVLLSSEQKKRSKILFKEKQLLVNSKEDLYHLKIEGVHVGIDIYESYLRDHNQATVDISDPRLQKLLEAAVELYIFWDDYFKKHKVLAYVTSHDSYVWMNIGCKLAYKYKVPVYLPNPRDVTFATEPFSIYKMFKHYRTWFQGMSLEEQEKALAFAESRINKKLGGELTIEMHYATASGFGAVDEASTPLLKKNDKIKILIASHCFFDNPHAYEELPFCDFYDWLNFLGEMSLKTDYDWYIKVHPDPLPGTIETVMKIINNYPKIKLINYKTSHHQLVTEGINFVFTCYGTIGEEYPLLGAQVVNASYNPRVAYDFNWHADSKESYRDLILDLGSLKYQVNKRDIYEFYYMNYYFNWTDDLIFDSYRKFLGDFKEKNRMNGDVYEYFINETSEQKIQEIKQNLLGYINSKKQHYFEYKHNC